MPPLALHAACFSWICGPGQKASNQVSKAKRDSNRERSTTELASGHDWPAASPVSPRRGAVRGRTADPLLPTADQASMVLLLAAQNWFEQINSEFAAPLHQNSCLFVHSSTPEGLLRRRCLASACHAGTPRRRGEVRRDGRIGERMWARNCAVDRGCQHVAQNHCGVRVGG